MPRFALSDTPFDTATLRAGLLDARVGGYASFEGWVRDHNDGRAVHGLHYEAYAALAGSEGERIIDEALARFDILDARCVHRIGDLAIGELAVWVGVCAAHRDAAFAACRFILDEVKSRVPIWKHERYADGDAGWLHPQP
ncbi:MAG TPA: molybdenum cofactor biosynthesis protein MoaE [Luteimonas sp.]|nr:molybdenum cofactor biosynthesis protein MoaE [Luteimonas sp.]